eukprot:c16684_g1_i1.p1 GENE.c16684_g1_i1~~c16684_g1_i1.p1  ORF type:complete len:318 (-),score=97.38 c16684_g1_i1:19-972(-)
MDELKVLVRHLVSQNKKRWIDDKYDLDLSYITENIIAMGLPASGIEGHYRNDISEVIEFLQEHHKGKFKIFNLCSEKFYDPSIFDGFVANFPFADDDCPPLMMIKQFCESAKDWLRYGIDNVVCIHCKAGKSRTGLMVCCLLMYIGYSESPKKAIDYFNQKRTFDGKGIEIPSQIRYVYYYHYLLKSGIPNLKPKRLISMTIYNPPSSWREIEIEISTNNQKNCFSNILYLNNSRKQFYGTFESVILSGDVKLGAKEISGIIPSMSFLFYFWFHTHFVSCRQFFLRYEIDKFEQITEVDDNFAVELVFEDFYLLETI